MGNSSLYTHSFFEIFLADCQNSRMILNLYLIQAIQETFCFNLLMDFLWNIFNFMDFLFVCFFFSITAALYFLQFIKFCNTTKNCLFLLAYFFLTSLVFALNDFSRCGVHFTFFDKNWICKNNMITQFLINSVLKKILKANMMSIHCSDSICFSQYAIVTICTCVIS